MHFHWVFSFLYASLVFSTTVIAIHPRATTSQSNNPFKPDPPRQVFPARGYLPPRVLTDTCASIDTGLFAELGPLMDLGFLDSVSTESHLCLCMKDLDVYLDTSTDMAILANLAGRDTLKAFLEVLIKTSPDKDCGSVNSTTHTYAICTQSFVMCDKNCDVKPSSGCAALSASKYDGTSAPAQCKRGEMACCTEANVEPCTECLRRAERNESTGNSCRHIPNVKEASYVGGRCVVSLCNIGWSPSAGKGACIRDPRFLSLRMKRVKARGTGNDSVTLDFHIVIDLTRIMRALSNLRIHSDYLRKNSTLVNTSLVLASTDKIIQAGMKLFLSRSIGSLLNHTVGLLNLAQKASIKLSDCTSGEKPGLDVVMVDVDALVDLAADILDWYHHSANVYTSSGPSISDVPITISLSQLFDDLGLGSTGTTIKANGLGGELSDTNRFLGDLSIGPGGERRGENAHGLGVESLLKQVETLVRLVLKLGNLGSLLASDADSSAKLATLAPVSLATLGVMTSTDISGLSNGLGLLALASTSAQITLSKYGDCGALVDDLSLVAKTAIAIKASCEEFPPSQEIELPFPTLEPVRSPSLTVSASTVDTLRGSKGTPVVIVLDGLLHRLGLSGVSANMTADGLGAGLSGTLNGVLSLLRAGSRKMAREENNDLSSVIFSESGLVKGFTIAAEGAIDLELKSANPGPVASLLAGLLPPVLGSLQAVLGSTTVTGLVSAVDDLLGSAKEMDMSLTNCNCATVPVLESSERFVTAVMGIQGWIDEHADVVRTEGADK